MKLANHRHNLQIRLWMVYYNLFYQLSHAWNTSFSFIIEGINLGSFYSCLGKWCWRRIVARNTYLGIKSIIIRNGDFIRYNPKGLRYLLIIGDFLNIIVWIRQRVLRKKFRGNKWKTKFNFWLYELKLINCSQKIKFKLIWR